MYISDCLFGVLYVKGGVIRGVRGVSCICLTVCLGVLFVKGGVIRGIRGVSCICLSVCLGYYM